MTAGPWSCPGPAGKHPAMLAAALRAGAAGLYCAEAGAELLTGQESWLCRSDFTGSFITLTPGLAGQAAVAVVSWGAAVAALAGGALPWRGAADAAPGGEHRRQDTSRSRRDAHRAGPRQYHSGGQGRPARRRAPGRHGHRAAGHPASPAEEGVNDEVEPAAGRREPRHLDGE
jgi:hypothetical protein